MRSLLVLMLLAGVAEANPRVLPFTYTTDTTAQGTAELEQFVDLVPLRAISAMTTKEESYLASALQTEIEIGLTDRLELGLYVTVVPQLGDNLAGKARFAGVGNGLKQRLRYRVLDAPIGFGVYGEVTENESEIELEGKLLADARFGRVRVAANLAVEYELYFSNQKEVVLAPSIGASYEVSPRLHLGFEAWMRGEYPDPAPAMRTFGMGPQTYAGPTVMASFGRVWWAFGAYARVSEMGHDLEPGEPYGRIWVRSMIGYDLSK